MPSIEYTRPPLVPYQIQIIDCPERFAIIEAATKSGKTTAMLVWLMEEALKCSRNQTVVWVAPVFSQSLIAFNRIREKITDRNFLKFNESRMTATLPHGAVMAFKSGDTPDSLYGDDYYAAVIDEASRIKEESWIAIRSTITKTKGKCKLIGNVKGRNNFFYRLSVEAKKGDGDFFYKKITAYDAVEAGILNIEDVEGAKRTLPERAFKELYLCEPSDDGGNPFNINCIQQCTYPISSLPPVCFGIDLAKSVDFTVIIGLDINGYVCYFDRFQKDWMQTVNTINALPKASMNIDSTGVGDPIVEQIQSKRNDVKSFKFTSFTKQQIMEGLAAAIQQRKIQFPAGPIKDELEFFEFKYTQTGVRYGVPDGYDKHDDCVCALALAWAIHKDATLSGEPSMGFV